ncbi:putative serine/threonine-protein kinase [Forsythia ovata]|uniref:Serine/threonine-protein kinase n=1 Tax=Forsythia ovata TaxID=205694 RepID=A0ABD1P770_9LAMI
MVHFFYNCTVYPPSVHDIKCLQRGAKHSYAFVNGSVPEFDWNQYCEDIVSVPVMEKSVEGSLGNGYGEVLKLGFMLTWKPDSVCQFCEDSGGFCGYKDSIDHNQTFFCLCNERHHEHNCYDHTGEVSTEPSHSNYMVIGAVIFGGLITASFILYLVLKKRNGVQKSGFSKIPRNYEK